MFTFILLNFCYQCKNSAEYYKLKLAAAEQNIKELSGQSLSSDEVPVFLYDWESKKNNQRLPKQNE